LARLLRGLGKGAVVWNRDPTPTVYKPLPGSERIHVGEEPPAGFPEKFDAIVVLECPSPDRTGLEKHLAERPVINIDHHLGNQCYGTVNGVDSAAPAVGEMIYRLAQGLKAPLEPELASCLYLTWSPTPAASASPTRHRPPSRRRRRWCGRGPTPSRCRS